MNIPIKLCKTTTVQDDTGVAPIVQVQFLSQVKDAVNAAPYGLHSSPVLNTPCLLITINNDPANSYILPLSFIERKNIDELQEGEVSVGNFTQKANILFDKDGNINIKSEQNLTADVQGDAEVNCSGDANVTANNVNITGSTTVVIGNNVTIDSRVFLSHIHSGVVAGSANSGPVV
jgi:hypothetical protein